MPLFLNNNNQIIAFTNGIIMYDDICCCDCDCLDGTPEFCGGIGMPAEFLQINYTGWCPLTVPSGGVWIGPAGFKPNSQAPVTFVSNSAGTAGGNWAVNPPFPLPYTPPPAFIGPYQFVLVTDIIGFIDPACAAIMGNIPFDNNGFEWDDATGNQYVVFDLPEVTFQRRYDPVCDQTNWDWRVNAVFRGVWRHLPIPLPPPPLPGPNFQFQLDQSGGIDECGRSGCSSEPGDICIEDSAVVPNIIADMNLFLTPLGSTISLI